MSSSKSVINTLLQMQCFFISLLSGSSVSVKRHHGLSVVPDSYRTTYDRQPFGIIMCGQLCKRLRKCQSALFSEEQLICYLTKNASMNYPLIKLDVIKNCTDSHGNTSPRLLVTRLHGQKCVTTEKYNHTYRDLSKHRQLNKEKDLKSYISSLTLHQACENGQLDKVRDILSHDMGGINRQGTQGRTPIMLAASKGHFKVFEYLVRQNCDLSLRDQNNDTVLHMACYGGNNDIVRKLVIELKYDVDEIGGFRRTPVMCAAIHGHTEVVDFLVDEGCNVTVGDINGNTILHIACHIGHIGIVEYIVKRNLVNIDSRGVFGRTAVLIAAGEGHKEIVKLLIREGCDPTLVDKYSNTIFHMVCRSDKVDIVKYLISENIVHKDSKYGLGRTPLLIAAWFGSVRVFDLLVVEGYSVEAVDADRSSVLHLACVGGHTDMVKHIINYNNVDIERKGFEGRTPLLTAAVTGQRAIFDFLIRKGCNANAIDDNKDTILHLACLGGHIDMVKHIFKTCNVDKESKGLVGRTPLLTTAGIAHKDIFDLLIRKGCNANAFDDNKNNILHLACYGGHLGMVKHIIKHYSVDLESKGFEGRTSLLMAAERAHKAIFNFLFRKGCNVKAVDDNKYNILHIACLGGNLDLVKFIIYQTKIDIESRALKGRSPLLTTAAIGSESIFYLLEKRGCNMKAVDDKNNNILHLACDGGNVRLVRHIITKHLFDIDCLGAFGMTPVLRAAYFGHTEVVEFLKGEGCNMNAEDDNGNNIMHTACFSGKADLVKYLIRLQIISVHDRNKHGQTSLDVAKALKFSELVHVIKGN